MRKLYNYREDLNVYDTSVIEKLPWTIYDWKKEKVPNILGVTWTTDNITKKDDEVLRGLHRERYDTGIPYGYPLMTFVSILGVAWMMVFGSSSVRPDDVVVPEEVLHPVSRSKKRTRREDPPDEPPKRSNFLSFD